MLECRSCGAALRFDIPSQKLKCSYCGSEYDPAEEEKLRSAKSIEPAYENAGADENKMEVYSFECPQCGGVLYGDSHDMTGFCRYCGSPVELAGRLTSIERPETVIPFKKTKDDCKAAFKNMTRANLFLPAQYKDVAHIDSFRGIYMPYYLYHVDYNGKFSAQADGRSYRRGDYIYTDQYSIDGTLNGGYEGFEHDSSTTFDDEISEAVGPFITSERMDFKAGYLSGFYADASDEEGGLYSDNAKQAANTVLNQKVAQTAKKQNRAIRNVRGSYSGDGLMNIKPEKAMYPVWFMSYNNNGRVAYAAVNGQTGKITADLPVDFKKFLLASLITAVPLFLLLNFFFVIVPSVMMMIYSLCCGAGVILLHCQAIRIANHDGIGVIADNTKKKQKKSDRNTIGKIPINVLVGLFIPAMFVFVAMVVLSDEFGISVLAILPLIAAIASFIGAMLLYKKNTMLHNAGVMTKGTVTAVICVIANIACALIAFLRPVADIWYYGGCLAALCCILAALLTTVKNHNYLATRRPVQFNKEGGDNDA